MKCETALLFLLICVGALVCVVVYQRFAFGRGTQDKLRDIAGQLRRIRQTQSDETVTVFTSSPELKELAAQVNALLEENRRVRADYRRAELSARKMLSNISHDIKTPMTVILGYLEIIRLRGGEPDEMLQKAEKKAQDVMELINQFFTLAKLEAGDMDIEISSLDACAVCRDSVLDFYEILTGEGFEVEIALPEKPVHIQGNRDALQRILVNLISNAIRYGADGKYLGLALRDEGKEVYIDVSDKGKGIEKAFAGRIFDRLFTMEDSRSRQIQGNGLGLTIAKNLAEQMGGSLTVRSTPQVLTVFTLKLRKIVY